MSTNQILSTKLQHSIPNKFIPVFYFLFYKTKRIDIQFHSLFASKFESISTRLITLAKLLLCVYNSEIFLRPFVFIGIENIQKNEGNEATNKNKNMRI